jgi:hypothetical protein
MKEMGDKLIMHCKGPMAIAVQYHRYVVNGKLFHILSNHVEKRTQNNGVCMPIVDGKTYYEKLT